MAVTVPFNVEGRAGCMRAVRLPATHVTARRAIKENATDA